MSSASEAVPLCGDARNESVTAEMKRILRVAGIESASMDPSSAKYLRDLIAVKLDEAKGSNTKKIDTKQPRMNKQSSSRMQLTKPFAVTHILSKMEATRNEAKKPPAKRDSESSPSIESASIQKTRDPTHVNISSTNSTSKETSTASNRVDFIEIEEELDTVESYSSLKNILISQQKTIEEQNKALLELTTHMRDLATSVESLQQTVETLKGYSPVEGHSAQHTAQHVAEADTNFIRPQNDANEFQRAHMLAHHVAWRVATFPLRAVIFYLKYEYRIWLVMGRLARRDVLNPLREAGMLFQLGFALVIVYGRIVPALEKTVNEQKRKLEQSGGSDLGDAADDDYYYEDDDAFLDDAEFQIQTLVVAIFAGFLYHVGVFGFVYRFFFRDRLHIRIWNDLREGVELTPTYGLDLDQDPPTEANENNNENENANNENENANNDGANANNENDNNNMEEERRNNDGNNNNNIPQPPNRNREFPNRNRDIDNDNGPLAELANIIGNGINDFFMGHGRRRRVAEEQAQAAMAAAEARVQREQQEQQQQQFVQELDQAQEEPMDFDNAEFNPMQANAEHRNPILGLFSDIVCLFYSFFVSILPGWNYEQQLRDIRDDDDRRLRAIMQREAEVLRNHHLDGDGESGSEDDSVSSSDSED